ncbi:hypothetical protein [Chondrinema litorale]|uniref:hypothetical protein n=1 Tax=Chondrinema litorale TaxID=2994555 RepID=UPI00254290F2|nr:hypothetical protein [Chondrinema litorale]UZR99386.1 hypothetical protein OQ292_35985 [Chondrinema litorale]
MYIKKVFTTAIITLFCLSASFASVDLPKNDVEKTAAEYEAIIDGLKIKVDSLAEAKKNANSVEERRAINKELREVKREVKEVKRRAGGGIYISVGALLVIIIILLLI